MLCSICIATVLEASYGYGLCVKASHWYIRIPYDCQGGLPRCEQRNCYSATGLKVTCIEKCDTGGAHDHCYGIDPAVVTKLRWLKPCNPNPDPNDPHSGCAPSSVPWVQTTPLMNQLVDRKLGTPCMPSPPDSEWLSYF
jgi:hypothetical protein